MRTALIICILLSACRSKKAGESSQLFHPDFTPGPPAIVYKTDKDYSDLVAVTLDEDGNIASYPAPSDLKDHNDKSPVELSKGYLLDRTGIGVKTAYLKWTIKEYISADTIPTLESMRSNILVSAPFTKMCNCGNANSYTDIKAQLNAIIDSDSLNSLCKKLK